MEKQSPKGSRELLRSTPDVDALPAEQSRIERPRTWPDEREGGADRREENARERVLRVRKSEREPDRRHERASNGRPQTGEQADACEDGEYRGGHCGRRRAIERGSRTQRECSTADQPHDEETDARPAASEGGEKPAHKPTRGYAFESARETLERGSAVPFRAASRPGQ